MHRLFHLLASETDSRSLLVSWNPLVSWRIFLFLVFPSLSRFIGVLVYSARWNHFWQLNKTLAQILSYLYSCINPFALYFLSSTFRHFYNRYLFFWRKQWCFRPAKSFDERQGPETLTFMELGRRSSANNSITAFSETNRIRLGSFFHQQNGQARVYRYVTSQKMSSDSEIWSNSSICVSFFSRVLFLSNTGDL